MAAKKNNYRQETINLRKEISVLRKELRMARQSGAGIQAQDIDALFIASDNSFKVYTEKTSDKIYRILIEKMHEGAVTLTEEGAILYCNSSFSNMVHLPLQKLIGTEFKTLIRFSKKKWDSLVSQSKNKIVSQELILLTAEHKRIPVLMSMNALSIDSRPILSLILTDLTIQNKNQGELKIKTKQLQQKNTELEAANKDLTSFTYVSSHDLQEPLRKIRNFATYILEEDEKNLSKTGKSYFLRMREVAQRMQTLIEDLLTYSEAKNSERKLETIDLDIIIDEVKKDFEETILEKKVTIEYTPLCDAIIIRFQFRQLMHNLFSNSLKFAKPSVAPHIKIESEIIKWSKSSNAQLKPNKMYCHITYTDNGIGFDPQYSDRIFQVFQRLHTQEEYKGTGIGLAICKRIIENHHGAIYASGKLNEGARFDIYIPA